MGLSKGINRAKGCFGRVGHNGVALSGPLGAALSGAAFLCKTAGAAMVTHTGAMWMHGPTLTVWK